MKADATNEDVARVVETVERLGFRAHSMPGANRTAIGVTGNNGAVDASNFAGLSGVAETIRVTKPYKLISNDLRPEKSVVKVGTAEIGGGELALISGVCSVETLEQMRTVAECVKQAGGKFFRGGAFKPRTSPYAFQGLGEKGLQMLADVRDEFGLNIVTEAMDENGVDLVEKYADMLQIGARNMQNFSLLKRAGQAKLPVLLKRGMSATLEELLLAAEYVMSEGNYNVVLCERGIRTISDHSRNTNDLSLVPAVRKLSHLPIIVDPSHGTGKNFMVGAMARAGVAIGADGILLEIHPRPAEAWSDGAQALLPSEYLQLVPQLLAIYEVSNPMYAAEATA